MRISLLILVSLVVDFGCKKYETPVLPCISHSNLSLSLNDSMRISSCDTRTLVVRIVEKPYPSNTILDTVLNQHDTAYVKFSAIGDYYILYILSKNISSAKLYRKQISVN